MDTKKSYSVMDDGIDVPCLWEYAFSQKSEDPAKVASELAAFLRSSGASRDDVVEVFTKLRGKGCLELSDEHSVDADPSLLNDFKQVPNCIAAMSFLQNDRPKFCSSCPAYEKIRLKGYLNRDLGDETELLAMMFALATDGDTREILDLGSGSEYNSQAVVSLFPSLFLIQNGIALVSFSLHYYLFYALYFWVTNGMTPCVDGAESMANGAVSVLENRSIPYRGNVTGLEALFASSIVRNHLAVICEKVKYRDRIDYAAAYRLLEKYDIDAYSDRKGSVILSSAAAFIGREPVIVNEDGSPVTEPEKKDDKAETAPKSEANTAPISPEAKDPADADPKQESQSAEPEQKAADAGSSSEEPVTVKKVDDEAVAEGADQASLSEIKTDVRSVNKAVRINGVVVAPLSSTGKPISGLLGPDNMINPYISVGEEIQLPKDVDGLTPLTLAISLESTVFYTVEYAICNNEEGFLCYIYQRQCTIFVSRSDTDFFNVILASFRRSIPKKLTMLAAPLLDFLGRMGETVFHGIIPVYDAYRLANHYSPTEKVKITDMLRPGTDSLAAAMRQYGMIWKNTGLTATDLRPAMEVASVYAASNYAYEFTGNRFPHLYHNEVTYQLNWQECTLRKAFLKVTLRLDPSKLTEDETLRCYDKLISFLGHGNKHLHHSIRLLCCDAINGFSYMVAIASYPWIHNHTFIRIGTIARSLKGYGINVTEEISDCDGGRQYIFDTKVAQAAADDVEGETEE